MPIENESEVEVAEKPDAPPETETPEQEVDSDVAPGDVPEGDDEAPDETIDEVPDTPLDAPDADPASTVKMKQAAPPPPADYDPEDLPEREVLLTLRDEVATGKEQIAKIDALLEKMEEEGTLTVRKRNELMDRRSDLRDEVKEKTKEFNAGYKTFKETAEARRSAPVNASAAALEIVEAHPALAPHARKVATILANGARAYGDIALLTAAIAKGAEVPKAFVASITKILTDQGVKLPASGKKGGGSSVFSSGAKKRPATVGQSGSGGTVGAPAPKGGGVRRDDATIEAIASWSRLPREFVAKMDNAKFADYYKDYKAATR